MDKIANGSIIKAEDNVGLRRFSILLQSCQNALTKIGYLNKIENPDCLRKIIGRLPFDMKRRWRTKADQIFETEEREIVFDDIVKFVNKEVRAASHPIFGDLSSLMPDSRDKHRNKVTQKTVKNFAAASTETRSEQQDRQCVLCLKDHNLNECVQFKKKTYEDRLKLVKEKGLCFNCLIPYHMVKQCRKKPACLQCKRKHETLLHAPAYDSSNPKVESPEDSLTAKKDASQSTNVGYVGIDIGSRSKPSIRYKVGLPIVPVKVRSRRGNKTVITLAFLDNGSNTTFCTERLKNELNVSGTNELNVSGTKTKLSLTTLDRIGRSIDTELINLEVYDLDDNVFFNLPAVFTRPNIPVTSHDAANQADVDKWPHLVGVTIPTIKANVDLLIGSDNSKVIEPEEVKRSVNGGPYAVKTPLGWVLNGQLEQKSSRQIATTNFIHSDESLNEQFKDFCNREFNDRVTDHHIEMSQEDKRANATMEESVQLQNGHYQIKLPFRNENPKLSDNRSMAMHRLNCLKKRLSKDPDKHQKYTRFMEDLMTKGYAEKVPDCELIEQKNSLIWYLPHHAVNHPQKPDKVRVVFDCSASYDGDSLNNNLLQGPDLTNSLVGVLTRFRQGHVAIMSDIEAMFHQVRVAPEHTDMLRFLWWPDGRLDEEVATYRMCVHLFGAASSPSCCNFALRQVAVDNKDEFDENILNIVNDNFYVDDCLVSVDDEDEAIVVVNQLRKLLKLGGFKLTKWISNSRKVIESVPESDRAATVRLLDLDKLPIERALGIQWNIETDSFECDIQVKTRPFTRRGILSIMSSVYDPLGFVSPFNLPAKIILQDLCRMKFDWDDNIPDDQSCRWKQWLKELPKLKNYSVKRCINPPDFGDVAHSQLHHFSDAAESGYGSVSYLRQVSETGEIFCTFMMSKSRVTPLKQISIPRLELSAAVVSTRLDHMIKRELRIPLEDSVFWTDSTAVLKFIENEDRRFHTFVANRITKIRDCTVPAQWHHIDSSQNPADDLSRGLSAKGLLESQRWLMGPEFLWKSEDNWPKHPDIFENLSEIDPEVKQERKICLATAQCITDICDIFLRFSSWYKLKKCISWILRYKNNLLKVAKREKKVDGKAESPFISIEEMNQAEYEILKNVQIQYFQEKYEDLAMGRGVKKSSRLIKLDPVLHKGLIRVGGRLTFANIAEDTKHQIILPKESHVTKLIIEHFHIASGHSGREYVLSLLRRKYWILKGSSTVRTILSRCFNCRLRQSPPVRQKMADLPEDRVTPDLPPFSYVGIDFFGPFLVKKGRSQVKRYGCLFTCLVVRAVHIEVTYSLDTSSFINALRRFIARRGHPVEIRTDNGGSFVSAEKELRQEIMKWNQETIHNYLLQQSVKWIFNPPFASHHGGVWERCIQTARKILNALLKEQTLDDENLFTFMCAVEAIMNGRPITKLSDDPKDLSTLSPSHLLLLRESNNLPPGVFIREDVYSRRRWKQVQYMSNQFWCRWLREYLPSLQERHKWTKSKKNVSIGDLVLLTDYNVPRGQWPKGVIQETYPDKHGMVRKVCVRTNNGLFERDIRKICVLESVNDKI